MIDTIRNGLNTSLGLLASPTVESVLPEIPAQTEAFAARALQRLYLRRWLVALSGLVIVAFVLFYQLPAFPAVFGFAVIAAGAAFLPREGLFNPIRRPARRAAERTDASQLLAALLGGLPAPAILLTTRGQVWGFNVQAAELLPGLRKGSHISAAIRDPRLLEAVGSGGTQAQGRQVVVIEERVPIERHMEATLSFIARSGETSSHAPAVLLFLRDLTQQERLNRMRADFIANASHELRTPLASLLGFIETLQGAAKNDPAAQQRFLGIMVRQAQRMARLIDNLLSLSRVEMRQHLRPQTRVELNETIGQVLTSLEPLAHASDVAVHFEGLDAPAIVLAERDEIAQVVSNLVHNAIKYGRPGGNAWIAITRAAEGGSAKFAIAVRDDGPGIAAEHLPRLTERFYRANGNGGEAAGTGLGLAIVKHVVARHRGSLRITSHLGEGTTFTILLDEAHG